jgi:DNA polymerase IV
MSVNETTQLEAKTTFYNHLANLFAESDDEDADLGRIASENALRGSRERLNTTSKAANAPSKATIARQGGDKLPSVTSNAKVASSSRRKTSPDVIDPISSKSDRPSNGLQTKPANETMTITPGPSTKPNTSKVSGKRKRETATTATAQNQLFSGLYFYFFPNNDVHPARRMRIAKAVQYGAQWEKQWSEAVTHIILDKSMEFSQLLKYLRLEALPGSVIAVGENYPAECIAYRAIVDPSQPKFAIKGRQSDVAPVVVPAQMSKTINLERSLSLKPAGKQTREQITPSQGSDESERPAAVVADVLVEVDHVPESIADSFAAPSVESNIDLAEAIREAKAMSSLPLDHEQDEDRPPSADSNAELNITKTKSKYLRGQDRFQCMQKNTGDKSEDCPNSATIDILQQMANYYEQTGNEWRLRAYRKAITTLRKHPVRIRTKEEAQALPNVGDRLAAKIEEIAFTNRLRRLDNAVSEPTDQILQSFMKIYGVGYEGASKWVRQGYKTLDELLTKASLTENQKIGIEHYDDFQQRIPRAEVEQHGAFVRRALHKIDPAFEVIVGGSYRRGAKDSGDIDCIITRAATSANYIRMIVTEQLMPALFTQGFLQVGLAVTSRDDGTKWHGASCLPHLQIWRRIDFLYVPSEELGAALIYFTGNDIFNRSLRLLASKRGLRLNQRGLYSDVLRGKGRVKLTEGTLLEGKSERRIFEILGVPWRPPEHRIC